MRGGRGADLRPGEPIGDNLCLGFRVTPKFSIVIVTFNRPVELRACLRSLAQLDCMASRFQVVVEDDGGTEPAPDALSRAILDLRLLVYRCRQTGRCPLLALAASLAGQFPEWRKCA